MNIRQIVAKNTILLSAAEVISRGLKFFLLIYAARVLGSVGFGEFNFALSFVSLLVIAADLGLSSITTRDFARDPEKEKDFSDIFSLKLLLSALVFVIMVVTSVLITSNPQVKNAIFTLGIFILTNNLADIIFAFFRARQQMLYEAASKILQAVIITGLGFLMLTQFPSVENFAFSYLIGGFVSFLAIIFFFYLNTYKLRLAWNVTKWKTFISTSWPLGIVAASVGIYNYTDSVMLGAWGFIEQTGWYNAAYKIIGVTTLPMILVAQSFYPALSKAYKESWERLQEIWNDYFIIGILFAVPLAVGGVMLSSKIISMLYGPDFLPAARAFQILIIGASGIIIMGVISHILIVADLQMKNFIVAVSGALLNIALNFVLIPPYNLYGAAAATVITIFFMIIFYVHYVRKFTAIKPLNRKTLSFTLISILAALAMYYFVSFAQEKIGDLRLGPVYAILLGSGCYAVTCAILYKLIWKNT